MFKSYSIFYHSKLDLFGFFGFFGFFLFNLMYQNIKTLRKKNLMLKFNKNNNQCLLLDSDSESESKEITL